MSPSRRSLLSTLAIALPIGVGSRVRSVEARTSATPVIRFRSFEEAVRAAFADRTQGTRGTGWHVPSRKVEVGHSELIRAGVQGCRNDRPFAGFPEGHLRIIRSESGPGPTLHGVRLFVATLEVALIGGLIDAEPGRPLDFASIPPAPTLG